MALRYFRYLSLLKGSTGKGGRSSKASTFILEQPKGAMTFPLSSLDI